MDKIPALVIDPKGDIANLLLTFPDLAASDFRPWINEDDAQKKGMSPDDFAPARRPSGKRGWPSGGRQGAHRTLPREGRPLSLHAGIECGSAGLDSQFARRRRSSRSSTMLSCFPSGSSRRSPHCSRSLARTPIRFRIRGTFSFRTSSPTTGGREGTSPWRCLSRGIQQPPFERIGIMDLEIGDAGEGALRLAMKLNNLLASPGFQTWLEGEPLDIKRMLHTPEGKPRISIFSIAHLGDEERMFFVSLLLNQMLGWMRSQSGTSSLRAMLYMDEILRLPAADGQPAVEEADDDDPQAGARLRSGNAAGHPESGRSRLQGAFQHRHVVSRAAADRAGQDAGARRPRGSRGGGR